MELIIIAKVVVFCKSKLKNIYKHSVQANNINVGYYSRERVHYYLIFWGIYNRIK